LSHNPHSIGGNLDVVSYIKEYLHLKKVSEGEDIESTQSDASLEETVQDTEGEDIENTQSDASLEETVQDTEESQADQKKEPPLHVKTVKEV
jgi:hypothetical protein